MTFKTGLLDRGWEKTQIKVFTRWVAKQLSTRHIPFEDLEKDFDDGTKLINLIEIVGKEDINQRYNKAPKLHIQKIENTSIALNFIQEKKGIKLIGITAEDICKGHLKMTLGLTWSLINKFQIEDISVEEATARDALLIWAKKNTQGYEDVNITNFSSSWSSGLGFCALINHFRPNVLDYNALDKADHTKNCQTAFAACKEIGIYVYLDPEDLVGTSPDEKSVVTQVAEFFHFFASESKVIQMAEKVQRTITIQRQIEEIVNNYKEQAEACIAAIRKEEENLKNQEYERTVPGVKARLNDVVKFGRVARPVIVELRSTAIKTWGTLIAKCNSTNRPIPTPPEGLEPQTLLDSFDSLEALAKTRRTELTNELADLEKQKIDAFDELSQGKIDVRENIFAQSNSQSGLSFAEQKDALEKLLAEAEAEAAKIPELEPPYDELCELKLNTRAKNTVLSVRSAFDSILAHIARLLEQVKAALFREANEKRIADYNAEASKYVTEAAELEASISEVVQTEGIRERRAALVSKQAEITNKRGGVQALTPLYQDLEKDGLHLGIVDTPDAVTSKYTADIQAAQAEVNKINAQLVAEFDALADGFVDRLRKIGDAADNLEGTLTEQKTKLEELTEQAKEVRNELSQLNEPFDYLTECKVSQSTKNSPADVVGESDVLNVKLTRLTDKNANDLFNENNNARIEAYNKLASEFVSEAKEFEETVQAIGGERVEKRTALLAKQEELGGKREKLTALTPEYQALEKDNLHEGVTDTPSSISSLYAAALTHITNSLGEIYDAMIADYDSLVDGIVSICSQVDSDTKTISGTTEEKGAIIKTLIEKAEAINAEPLDAPYAELCEFKLNYRAKQTPQDVRNEIDALVARLKHLEASNSDAAIEENNAQRIQEYTKKAEEIVGTAKEFEIAIASVEGTLEEKQKKLFELEKEVETECENAKVLDPMFEALEKDELHLQIEDTPDSVAAFYANIVSHIQGLVRELDSLIAAEKGLVISEDKLVEFRETFSHFDKDGSKTLTDYELKACLTALGETSTYEECKEICKKYSSNNSEELDFDGYVKFMLDLFSKAETADSTMKAFKAIAAGNPIITDSQIDQYFGAEDAAYLKSVLTQVEGGYDFEAYVKTLYAEA